MPAISKDLTLNKFMQPVSSLAAGTTSVVSGYEVGQNFERDSITLSKIRNFNFSAGTGGTLVLGGTANGNGQMLVRTASGGTAVQIDNAGLTIYSGNIAIQNSSNTTILDTSGIVSSANFAKDQIFSNTTQTTTGTTYSDIPGATMNSFVLQRSSVALITAAAFGFNARFHNDGSHFDVQLYDSVDGGLISFPVMGQHAIININFAGSSWTTTFDDQEVSISAIIALSAGTHIPKLQFRVSGTGTAVCDAFLINYIILGS